MGGYSSGIPSITITPVPPPGTGLLYSVFNEIFSLATSSTGTIISHTVPALAINYVTKIEVSGTNIATYDVYINGLPFARRRTYFGGSLGESIDIAGDSAAGYKLAAGDVLEIKVTNFRPSAGNFEARLQYSE